MFGTGNLAADEASQFRGPNGNGVFPDSLPARWNGEAEADWTVDIPGSGWSSPVVAGELVFVTTAVAEDGSGPKGFGEGVQSMGSFFRSKAPDQPYRFEVHCLKLSDGSRLWKTEVISRKPPLQNPSLQFLCDRISGHRWRQCLRLLRGGRRRCLLGQSRKSGLDP